MRPNITIASGSLVRSAISGSERHPQNRSCAWQGAGASQHGKKIYR